MLRHLNLTPGDRVLLQGRLYSFATEIAHEGAGLSEARDLAFKDARTGAQVTLTLDAFHQLYVGGEVRLLRAHETPRDRLPEMEAKEGEAARWRRLWCEAYDAAPCSRSDRRSRPLSSSEL
jgi:hypothetical protein